VEEVNSYIGERIKSADGSSLAPMIRVKAADGKEYYVYKDYILTVTLDKVFTARKEFRDHYVDEWSEALRNQKRLPEMTDDSKFEKNVESRLRGEDPLLASLLNFNLLFLARQEGNVPAEVAGEIDEIIDKRNGRLQSLPVILNLDRRKLYADARLLLPFWQAIPVISKLMNFLKRVFVGRREEEKLDRHERAALRRKPPVESTTIKYGAAESDSEPPRETGMVAGSPPSGSSGASRRAQVARFKEAVRQLQQTYVRPGATPESTLEGLIERWNPLLDPVAKKNLVEDINSLSRDFLRRMKVSFRLIPPNRHRVQEWADRLAKNQVFDQIRRTDDLKEYIQLYMLTVLGK
jgi:hypothetical protein